MELHVNMELLTEAVNEAVLTPDTAAEAQFLPPPTELAGELLLGDRGYFDKNYLAAVHRAGGSFIVRGKANLNPLLRRAFGSDGQEIKSWRGKRLKEMAGRIGWHQVVDLDVRFTCDGGTTYDCRLVAHRHPREGKPRYLVTNLDRARFNTEQVADAYRLRWQIELLFKEWKSYANLRAFATGNAAIAEGLIWAALCAATLKRYCAHMTQRITGVAISTHWAAMCIHHVLTDIFQSLLHAPKRLAAMMTRAIDYLSKNARRAHPQRDVRTRRLKLDLRHVGTAP